MDALIEPQETSSDKFQKKLADSRFFFLSLTIHVVIVFVLGGVVLVSINNDPPDFVAEGGDGLMAPADNSPPAQEQPSDAVPVESFQQPTPTLSAPTVDILSTTSTTSSFKVAPSTVKVNIQAPNTADLAKATGNVGKTLGGIAGSIPGSMKGRVGAGRGAARMAAGGKDKSEQAVLRGLEWLRLNQNGDGSWGDKNKGGMTGFALLCFLGHGETGDSPQYGVTVNKAVQWVIDNGTKFQGRLSMDDNFTQPGVYEHGIMSYALGEYYTMTKDERVVELFKQAMGHIIQGQGPDGGWMYGYDKTKSDTSVSGWQIQALKAAHLSELKIPGVDEALDRAMKNLERVKGKDGGYGYRDANQKYSLTGVGILCSLFWKGDRGELRKGMDWMLDTAEKQGGVKYKGEHADLYAWYYHTQACLMFGGAAWQKWNRWFQDEIVAAQSPDGSWPQTGGKGHRENDADKTGQVYRTTLCILMLEVFYRYMPTNKG
jgi:hypothetical protein